MVSATHSYTDRWCYVCRNSVCLVEPPAYDPNWKPPREDCPHPRQFLVQMHQDVCDPDLVTVCGRCGLAWPGKTIEDLLAA